MIDKIEGWINAFILLLPNLVLAVVIVVAAAFLARLVRRVVAGLLHRATDRAPQAKNVVDLLATLAYVAVLAVGTFIALGVLDLELVGAVDREQLLRARLAQTVLRRDALALEERLHLHRVRRHNFISDRWS